MMKGSVQFLAIGVAVLLILVYAVPRIPTGGTSIRIGEVRLYDETGALVGTVKPNGVIPGALIGSGGLAAKKAMITVEFTVEYQDAPDPPPAPTAKIFLVDLGLVPPGTTYGELIGNDEWIDQQMTVTGQWTHIKNHDYSFTQAVAFEIDADEAENVQHREAHKTIQAGDRFQLAAILQVTAGDLTEAKRSTNTVTLEFQDDPEARLVIQKVTVG